MCTAQKPDFSMFEKMLLKFSQEHLVEKLKFSMENTKSFRDSSLPRAGWSVRLVLVWATLCVQKLILSVFDAVKSPGQSFYVWHFPER